MCQDCKDAAEALQAQLRAEAEALERARQTETDAREAQRLARLEEIQTRLRVVAENSIITIRYCPNKRCGVAVEKVCVPIYWLVPSVTLTDRRHFHIRWTGVIISLAGLFILFRRANLTLHRCGEHFCFACGKAYSAEKIYSHMGSAHGGIYQGDDDD